jgi:hypothetical protein
MARTSSILSLWSLNWFPEDCLKNYEMPPAQLRLIDQLFTRKNVSRDTLIVLDEREREILLSEGDAGIEESRELLKQVGIVLPG